MGWCMRNCYGTDLADIKLEIKLNLPDWLLDFLLDLSKCINNQNQRNGLGNFNALSIFALKQLFDKVDRMDKDGSYYDLSSPRKIFDEELLGIMLAFDDLLCNGGSSEIDEILERWFPGGKDDIPAFPPNIPEDIIQTVYEILDENNNNNESKGDDKEDNGTFTSGNNGNGDGNNGSGNGSGNGNSEGNGLWGDDEGLLGNGGDGKGNSSNGDGSNSNNRNGSGEEGNGNGNLNGVNGGGIDGNGNNGDGSNSNSNNGNGNRDDSSGNRHPLMNIPNEVIEDIDLTMRRFKCFHPVFDLHNYVFIHKKEANNMLFITDERKRNIKRVHNEIILPIYRYYYGEEAVPVCQIHINLCLASYKTIFAVIQANAFSKHIVGSAVDFSLVGVDHRTFINDLREGNIPDINYGVVFLTGGSIHMTLPYTFENLEIKKMYLESPRKEAGSMEIEFF